MIDFSEHRFDLIDRFKQTLNMTLMQQHGVMLARQKQVAISEVYRSCM